MQAVEKRAGARRARVECRVADEIAAQLERAGVRHVFGVGGANIEDVFAAVQRRQPELRVLLTKHEHGAGTAADAYARIGGGLGVVLATSGGGAMNLVHALAEARASGVPVLALVGEPPLELQGRGAFQDTSGKGGAIDALAVFRAVSLWCERASSAEGVPEQLDRAIEAALGRRGPAVLLLEKNVQCARLSPEANAPARFERNGARDGDVAVAASAPWVAEAACRLATGSVLVIAGEQVARDGGVPVLARLVERLDARVAVTPDGRDAFDNAHARFVGVAGAMGHATVIRALEEAAVCLLVGTRLPLLARQGLEPLLGSKVVVSLGRGRPFVEPVALHAEGSVTAACDALVDELPARTHRELPPRWARVVSQWSTLDTGKRGAFDMENVLACIGRSLPEGAVLLADAGNTGASVAHHVDAPRGGRTLIAMGMAGMGYSFGAAIGAACASGKRCFVCAGDGAFFMHGMEVHTAVEHALPITFIVFNNRAHGMCLMRERLLIGEEHRYNTFKEAHVGAAFAALCPGLPSHDCRTLGELEQALSAAAQVAGPALIALELPEVEVPPFAALRAAAERLSRARGNQTP
jgi:acetolactate synthase-1/2/3 large subunit